MFVISVCPCSRRGSESVFKMPGFSTGYGPPPVSARRKISQGFVLIISAPAIPPQVEVPDLKALCVKEFSDKWGMSGIAEESEEETIVRSSSTSPTAGEQLSPRSEDDLRQRLSAIDAAGAVGSCAFLRGSGAVGSCWWLPDISCEKSPLFRAVREGFFPNDGRKGGAWAGVGRMVGGFVQQQLERYGTKLEEDECLRRTTTDAKLKVVLDLAVFEKRSLLRVRAMCDEMQMGVFRAGR